MRRPVAAVALGLLLVAGCGSEPDDAPSASGGETSATDAFPVTVDGALGSVTLDEAPDQIVSLSPTATETLFAVGAGDQVVAVDDQSDFPAEAPTTDLSGFTPNLEAIIEYEPDLVIISDDTPSDVTEGLERLEVPVLAKPAAEDLPDAYQQIRDIGALTGNAEQGDEVATEMQAEIEALLEEAPDVTGLTVYHELTPDFYAASSETFIGTIYAEFGLENIADEGAESSGSEYPQLSAEAILTEDPDVIVLADGECCGQTPETVAERPGWDELAAVRDGTVVAVDEDIASRWGPRLPEAVAAFAAVLPETSPAQ